MALIKVDPKQTKTVVALVGVLAVALGVTAFRLKPQAATQGADQANSAQSSLNQGGSGPARVRCEADGHRARNPFERPAGLQAAAEADDDTGVAELSSNPAIPDGMTWTPGGWATVEPADPGSLLATKPDQNAAPATGAAEPDLTPQRPVFTLVATAKGDRGCTAVIRVGESDARVVEVGDTLEGGFKVIDINRDRAVLTNGRETVAAKRPQ